VAHSLTGETSISERYIVSFGEAGIRFVQNVGKFLQAYKYHNPEERPKIFHHPKNFKILIFFLTVREPLMGLNVLFGDSSITFRHTTLGRTPLVELSARRRAKFLSRRTMLSNIALVICASSCIFELFCILHTHSAFMCIRKHLVLCSKCFLEQN
jgi:hypothetical protein